MNFQFCRHHFLFHRFTFLTNSYTIIIDHTYGGIKLCQEELLMFVLLVALAKQNVQWIVFQKAISTSLMKIFALTVAHAKRFAQQTLLLKYNHYLFLERKNYQIGSFFVLYRFYFLLWQQA